MLTYIGVDLGQKGGIAVYTELAGMRKSMKVFSMWDYHGGTALRTATQVEIKDALKQMTKGSSEIYACIEHPVFMPGNGKKAIAGLFENFGFFQGLLLSYDVQELWTPTPRAWQKVVKGASSDKTKNLVMARKLYSATKDLTKDNSDAILICHACKVIYG
jgi:hypothetical protein